MRISFLLLLLNSLFFSQIASAVDEETKLKSSLLKAIKTHDTPMVRALADGGYESIDRDDVLQEMIYNYFEEEKQRIRLAEEKAKADLLAAEEKAAAEKLAAEKAEADAAAAQKAAEERAIADALAIQKAKEKAKADAIAAQKAKEKWIAEEKKRKAEAAAKAKAAKIAAVPSPAAAPAVHAAPEAVAVAAVVAVPAAVTATQKEAPTVSDDKLTGTWKQVNRNKEIALTVNPDTTFSLSETKDDSTLTISGTWKSDKNAFMMSINNVQRNVHSRAADIQRIYKVEKPSSYRLVLRDKYGNIAYDLKR